MNMQNVFLKCAMVFLLGLITAGNAQATAENSCYSAITYGEAVDTTPQRALYIIIDQTMPLSADMKMRIEELVGNWGRPGDAVKIARFSANFRGSYPSVEFSSAVEPEADQQYLYGLHWKDKKQLLACLDEQHQAFKQAFNSALKQVLSGVNSSIPKTEIFYSLKNLAKHMLDSNVANKNVLLVSDGLANSAVTSFYGRGKIRLINERAEISKIRRQGLIAHWEGANIYMYGLGLPPKKENYIDTKKISRLQRFWEHYFVEGSGNVVALGTPELLIDAIQ